jgi:hypothetical protein
VQADSINERTPMNAHQRFFATAMFLLWPVGVWAQTDNRLAIGGSVTTRIAGSSAAAASSDVGFELRIGHEHEGWGWANSFFSWFDTDIQQPTTLSASDLGRLRIRPFMFGYGYTRIRGRAAITADLVGGFALNSFHLDQATIADYQRRGATDIRGEATNTFVLKPELTVWYDLNSRFGIKVNGGYLVARPTVTVASTLGRDARSVRADTFLITFGVVYSIM